MCGIAGIIDKSGRLGAEKLGDFAKRMAMAMTYRGPDDMGVWVSPDGRCALSQRRLAIIDLSPGGHQPMLSHDGKRAITFNGEIYNFLELRAELEKQGLSFRSHSDTEVLLALLGREHAAVLPRLDAMFAFAHYDMSSRELLLARDLFGEKPLYYIDTPDYFAFASELHVLTLLPNFDATIDREAIAAYLAYLYVPHPDTIYRSVKKLPPSSYLTLSSGGAIELKHYFAFRTSNARSSGRSLDDLCDELEELLTTSVRRRMISDVPLGAFLSGGVDSSTVAAIAVKKLGAQLKTFSIGFENHAQSEHFDAAEVARMLGTDHYDRILATEALELGHHISAVLDEPNGDSSCLPTYLLSGFAREQVTVALSGDGGDELFGGYGRYFNTVDEWEKSARGEEMPGWWSPGAAYMSNRILVYPDDCLSRLMGEVPEGLASRFETIRNALNAEARPPINVLRELDAGAYMPGAVLAKVDRMSMQHSLEVRAPLIGIDIARFAMGLGADECYADGVGKVVLKRLAKRYLPASWIDRPKRGFGLPETLWGAQDLLPRVRELVLGPGARLTDWIPRDRLEMYVSGLETNFHAYQTWALYILEGWLRTHPAKPAGAAVSEPVSLAERATFGGVQLLRSAKRASQAMFAPRRPG